MPLPAMTHSSAYLLPAPTAPSNPTGATTTTYALVVLNQRLPRFAPLLWSRARLRVCADGGANRVFDGMPELLPGEDPAEVRTRYKPDVIKGDMDSIRPEVKEYYSNLIENIELVLLDSLLKIPLHCGKVMWLAGHRRQVGVLLHEVVSLVPAAVYSCSWCTFGGRFDHEMGNINVLYRFSNIKIILLSDDCSIFLLPKTHSHEIHIEKSVEGPHCGLIPMGGPSAITTTTGLRWNLDNTSMRYGGLISTSNIVDDDKESICPQSILMFGHLITNFVEAHDCKNLLHFLGRFGCIRMFLDEEPPSAPGLLGPYADAFVS
ncbi:unnamed protein product [Miscanthus lutarioriparius]|uniref:thiamine diphosphokinase n=1 Tax=Miscanthus lutarioriparius TaxID=422564 RepID=A0A811NUC3_9POAL|nr:unnamed protein product [Miscanthus lutarioriparius]